MNKYKNIVVVLLLLISKLSIAQFNELSDQDLVLRMWKTYNYTQNNDDNIIKQWLSIFDKKNYSSYAKNEFLMRDKLDQTKQDIQQRLDNMQNPAIYCYYDSRSFGEYDFNLEQYKFKPFSNLSTEKHFVYTFLWNDKLFSTNLKITGLDFVNGIPMPRVQAEQFLNNRAQKNIWGQSSNNRAVYLKVFYYNSINEKFPANSNDAYYQYIKGTPILVQAYNDKNYTDFLCEWWSPTITTFYKQQLINNNVPRGFFESLNQPSESKSTTKNIISPSTNYDKDGDGIINEKDNCPDVPGMIAAQGCPDKDGDGVSDDADKCPDVSGPASNKGCPEIKEGIKKRTAFAARNIQFETSSTVIKTASYIVLDELATLLNEYPYYDVNIDGHCDHIEGTTNSFGSALYLSQARARAAYDYLISKGISTTRMITAGYGYDKPIADDYTSAGRAQNRRVEFNLIFKDNNASTTAASRQNQKFDIWKTLYPNSIKFDNEKRLIRYVARDGNNVELRTKKGTPFYYKLKGQQMMTIILFSYTYENGYLSDCHVCRPEFDVATFSNTNGIWTKQCFIENWSGGSGSWGNEDEVTFETYNNIDCIKISGSYGNQGTFTSYTHYYDIETLKKIKSIEKEE